MAKESQGRKRRRPTSKLTSMIAVENATVPIQFLEGQKVYHLQWDELLTVEAELPFEVYEDLQAGTHVLAPWCDKDGDIDIAEAVVVNPESVAADDTANEEMQTCDFTEPPAFLPESATEMSNYSLEPYELEPSFPDHATSEISNRNIYGEFSGHDRSHSRPPINHSYRQEEAAQALFHTPTIHKPHPSMQRRFTYPPTPGYSICTPSSSDLDYTPYHSEDKLSSFSGLSSISQHNRQSAGFRYMSPVPSSSDLQFVYRHWISPLKQQLADMQKELRNILTINTPNPFNLPAPLNSAMGMISNAQAGNVSFPGTLANPNPTPTCGAQNSADDDGGTDDIPKESNHGPGVFLGYPNRDKYRVWVADLTQNELEAAERSCVDYIDLGKKLLQLLFNKELSEPDNYCRTKSDGKQLLDQMKLKGMRFHLHRKFCSKKGIKMYSNEENLWDKCLKKMNARIRYGRTLVKKTSK